MNNKPGISVLGCGWYGLELAKALVADGYSVKGSTTTESKLPILESAQIEAFLVDFELATIKFDPKFFNNDVLIISIPPKRSSPTLINFPEKIEQIALAAMHGGIKQVLLISSTGVFQDGNSRVDEHTLPKPDTDSGKMMYRAENILGQNLSFTTTIIRFAGLIGPNRNLARHFAGKSNISNGLAPINLIHLTDCIGLTKKIITLQAFGKIYHGVMPNHPTREAFYTEACAKSGFEKPIFNKELLTWKQIESIHVPQHLGYQYVVADFTELANSLMKL